MSGPGSESVVRETVEQLKTLGLSTMNIVTFQASISGVTLIEHIDGYNIIWHAIDFITIIYTLHEIMYLLLISHQAYVQIISKKIIKVREKDIKS